MGHARMHLAVDLLIWPVLRAGPAPGDDERTRHKKDTPQRSVKTRVTFSSPRAAAQHNFGRLLTEYSQSTPDSRSVCGRVEVRLWRGRGWRRRVGCGVRECLCEEPAVQDVEPVTLDFVSCLIVLPGPPGQLETRRASVTSER
jgi:hypothetical protein